MDVPALHKSSAPVRVTSSDHWLVDKFGRISIENGQGVGRESQNNDGLGQYRKISHDVPLQKHHLQSTQQPTSQKSDEKSKDLLKAGDLIKGRWRVLQKIGGGGFGEIYEAVDTTIDSEKLAVLSRGDSSDLCPFCAYAGAVLSGQQKLNSQTTLSNNLNRNRRICAGCGRDFYSPQLNGYHSHSAEDALESADSGNSSGYSERPILPTHSSENHIVAIKTESNTQPKQMLRMEVAVMRRLTERANFCELLACGKNARINYIVMSLQGKNLSELRKKAPNRSFSLSTSLRIICKCLDAVEDLHTIGFLHRDIKPSNFCLRRDNPTEVCLLDFGLVRQYVTASADGRLREPRSSAGFRGTVRYASITAHKYQELGRHDDLWSMYYMLVEMLSGQLPWHRRNEKDVVRDLKSKEEPVNLGVMAGLPQSVAVYWSRHLGSLNYYETPNYRDLRKVIENWISVRGISWDDLYDWQIKTPGMSRGESSGVYTQQQQIKRNTQNRQFVPNSKRSIGGHNDSTGVLRRLDKRPFGSTTDLKRIGSEGDLVGRSTVAVADDALTNQNKTQVPGCVTMATENQLPDDGDGAGGGGGANGRGDEDSAKVDGKEKMMASHLDFARGIGDSTDRNFLATSRTPAVAPWTQLEVTQRNELAHRHHGNDFVFLQPENRPLLPLQLHTSMSKTPPTVPPHLPENAKFRMSRLPPKSLGRRGDLDVPSTLPLPTPKPRNRQQTPTSEDEHEDIHHRQQDENERGWLCRDDLRGGVPLTLLARSTQYRLSSGVRSAAPRSRSPAKPFDAPQRDSMSAEILRCKGSDLEDPVYRSHMEVRLDSRKASVVVAAAAHEPRLPFIDGRSRLLPTDLMNSSSPVSAIGAPVSTSANAVVIKRPTVGVPDTYSRGRGSISSFLNSQ